jgi:hypothetical protein
MAPEFPDVVVPELKTSAPLTPATPELEDRMLTIPELVAVPSPDPILTSPPVSVVPTPAYISTKAPEPDVPLPTATSTEPDRPPVAAPVPMTTAPEFPDAVVPELNTSMPLTPDTPEFALRILMIPDVVAVPSPDPMLTSPPVLVVLRPA